MTAMVFFSRIYSGYRSAWRTLWTEHPLAANAIITITGTTLFILTVSVVHIDIYVNSTKTSIFDSLSPKIVKTSQVTSGLFIGRFDFERRAARHLVLHLA